MATLRRRRSKASGRNIQPLSTDAYSEMKRGCMPKFTRWFEHCVTVEFPEKWVGNKIRNSNIFIEYQAWLPAAARGQDSATKVGNKLKDFFKKEKGHRVPMEEDHLRPVSYTHLTLPTKRIV